MKRKESATLMGSLASMTITGRLKLTHKTIHSMTSISSVSLENLPMRLKRAQMVARELFKKVIAL